jgi:SAM-dependent methyltransferase
MPEARDLIQQQFGAHAQNYVTSVDHVKGESLDHMLALVKPESTWRVLDVATGGGHTALAFAPHVHDVVASDLTPQMLTAAEAFVRSKGITNISFRLADACALPFHDGEFDLVTCRIAPHHFPDCARFVQECARVLRPGGQLAVVDNVTPAEAVAARHINAFEKLRDPSHHWAYSAVDWEAFFRAAGFDVRHLAPYRKSLDFEGFCDRLSVPAHTRQQLRVMLRQAPAEALAALEPKFHADPQAGPITFTLGEVLIIGQRT